jgi:hypothetical protein
MAAFDIVRGLRFVPRSEWGASPQFPRLGAQVDRNRRTHVVIHHTVMIDSGDDTPNIWESEDEVFHMMRRLQTVRPDLGLDVPYSFVAFMTSENSGLYICEGRGEDRVGAHTKGHNTAAIGISFSGDFENKPVEPVEVAARMPLLSFFLGWLRFNPSHPAYGDFRPMNNLGSLQPQNRRVFFHQDFKMTDCPGSRLKLHLTQVDFIAPRAIV